MQFQRCPNCQKRNDVSVYVQGQMTRCAQCGVRFAVDRESTTGPSELRPASNPKSDPRNSGKPSERTEISEPRQPPAPPPIVEASEPIFVHEVSLPALPEKPKLTSGQLFPTPAQRPNAPGRPTDHEARTEAANAPKGPNIPGYECSILLGRGGMGEVWKARQLSLGRIVAVKLLSPTLAVEPDFVRRFERESSALAALAHPNIVQVFDRGSANGHWYFTMEYVEGRSLRDKHAEKPYARNELLRLLAQVSRAVDYAHQKGVIHRDLKPENILVDHVGSAKVADFGLAGMSEVGRSSLTMSAVAMGTAHYMAPEQRKDAKKVDGRADLYSIGVMLYELMTNELPAGRFKTPKEKVPELDSRLDELILKLLDQEPSKRPARASEVAELLELLVDGPRDGRSLPPPVHTTKVLSSVVRSVRASPKHKAMAAGAAALLAVALGIGIWKGAGNGPRHMLLPAKVDRIGGGKANITFGTGAADAIYAVGGGWTSTKDGLIREADSANVKRATRAYLMPLRLDFDNAAIEADVVLDETTGATSSEPPCAEIVLYRDNEHHVGFRLSIAEDASYQLFYAAENKGKPLVRTDDSGHEPDPKPGKAHHLELYVIGGRVTAFVDKRQVASASVQGLGVDKAKAGLGCRVGRCRFSNVRLGGSLSEPPAAPSPAAAQNKQ